MSWFFLREKRSWIKQSVRQICHALELIRYLKSGFLAPQEHPIAMTWLLRRNVLSEFPVRLIQRNLEKLARPAHRRRIEFQNLKVESRKPLTARRSISHSFAKINATRQEISNLMSAQEVEKPAIKVVIRDTYSVRSGPDTATANIVKNICNRQWKPVVNATFVLEKLREELWWSLAKHLARKLTAYTRNDRRKKS